jgi:hypothetical protein
MEKVMRNRTSRRLNGLHARAGTVILLAALLLLSPAILLRAAPGQVIIYQTLQVHPTKGADTPTCGTDASPCRTIAYTIAQRARANDVISLAVATYDEHEITVDKPLLISGADTATTIIDGQGLNIRNVFYLYMAGAVTMENLTIRGGTWGIDLQDGSALTLKNVLVTGNKYQGGILDYSKLTIVDSAITNNEGTDGAGIAVHGALTMSNSTISGNRSTGDGGGLGVVQGSATLTNTTISGNTASAGGAIANLHGSVTLDSVTIATNSTGLSGKTEAIQMRGSLIANLGANCVGAVQSTGHNASSDATCGLAVATDQQNADLRLGALADNGGPTQTHALLPGSAAIDKGGDGGTGCLAVDQRGIARPQGAACDIGAFEMEQAKAAASPTPTPTNTSPAASPTPTPTNTPTSGTTAASGSNATAGTSATNVASAATPSASAACPPLAPNSPFVFPGFQAQWQQGEGLAPNFWGPAVTPGMQEQYAEAPGSQRLVQYFDKGRMELTNPGAGTVTNGLLANELITGQMQMGDGTFQARAPAAISIAGDPDNPGPTYAALGTTAAAILTPTEYREPGTMVTASIAANGTISPGNATTGSGPTAITVYDNETEHNVPQAFAQYRDKVGLPTIGYAKSEPFFATVKVGGVPKQVMIQIFERRVLTYTADNPAAFQVEMGNIGQHYYRWRYCTV